MFTYQDKEQGKVLVITTKCTCPLRRPHPLPMKTVRCCCCILKWKAALVLLAIAIILYGLISFGIWAYGILIKNPSGLYLWLEFPAHTAVTLLELVLSESAAIMLMIACAYKLPKMILFFAWYMLLAYVLAGSFVVMLIYEGPYMVPALLYAYFNKEYERGGENASYEHIIVETSYYSYAVIHILLLVSLATYVAVMTKSYYERLKENPAPIGGPIKFA